MLVERGTTLLRYARHGRLSTGILVTERVGRHGDGCGPLGWAVGAGFGRGGRCPGGQRQPSGCVSYVVPVHGCATTCSRPASPQAGSPAALGTARAGPSRATTPRRAAPATAASRSSSTTARAVIRSSAGSSATTRHPRTGLSVTTDRSPVVSCTTRRQPLTVQECRCACPRSAALHAGPGGCGQHGTSPAEVGRPRPTCNLRGAWRATSDVFCLSR